MHQIMTYNKIIIKLYSLSVTVGPCNVNVVPSEMPLVEQYNVQ